MIGTDRAEQSPLQPDTRPSPAQVANRLAPTQLDNAERWASANIVTANAPAGRGGGAGGPAQQRVDQALNGYEAAVVARSSAPSLHVQELQNGRVATAHNTLYQAIAAEIKTTAIDRYPPGVTLTPADVEAIGAEIVGRYADNPPANRTLQAAVDQVVLDYTPTGRRLAEEYAPILVLSQEQYNLPADPEEYDAPVFYEFDDSCEPPRLTYHIFYAYNDGPLPQNHEGDWERITLELDPDTLQPVQARYSAHKGNAAIAWEDLPKDPDSGRPLFYVAGGSHANYATPGEHATEVTILTDHAATDDNGDGVIDRHDGALRFDTGANLHDVTEQAWYPQVGAGLRWGEIGEFSFTSGPHGPSAEKGHLE